MNNDVSSIMLIGKLSPLACPGLYDFATYGYQWKFQLMQLLNLSLGKWKALEFFPLAILEGTLGDDIPTEELKVW